MENIERLLMSCTDRPKIVATISQFLRDRDANILQSDQHTTDPKNDVFFMRTEFQLDRMENATDKLERAFVAEVASRLRMDWRMYYATHRKRVAILVSRYDHCLAELLWRWSRDELHTDIPLVVSNHPDLRDEVERFSVRYEHIPIPRDSKPTTETTLLELLDNGYDLIVLARYMQILNGTFLEAVRTPIINIHHSFLPTFANADPYTRAYERNVKIIGATTHYVTKKLDAGPIIEQDVAHVTHRDNVATLVHTDSDLERIVLLRAVRWHLKDRILVHGNRTIVFR